MMRNQTTPKGVPNLQQKYRKLNFLGPLWDNPAHLGFLGGINSGKRGRSSGKTGRNPESSPAGQIVPCYRRREEEKPSIPEGDRLGNPEIEKFWSCTIQIAFSRCGRLFAICSLFVGQNPGQIRVGTR
jgi:hypothetical protein